MWSACMHMHTLTLLKRHWLDNGVSMYSPFFQDKIQVDFQHYFIQEKYYSRRNFHLLLYLLCVSLRDLKDHQVPTPHRRQAGPPTIWRGISVTAYYKLALLVFYYDPSSWWKLNRSACHTRSLVWRNLCAIGCKSPSECITLCVIESVPTVKGVVT